jgi:hypothetical protein
MIDYDHPYKRLFSHPIMMADLILGYLDPELVKVCDISSLKRCNGSYVTDDLREREDDLIWKLKWGDREMVLYLLIEFQSRPDSMMHTRMMSYMALLWQDLVRTGAASPHSLPGIIPLVLYNGEEPWNVPHNVKEVITMPSQACYLVPSVPYLVLDELRLEVLPLLDSKNLAACLFALEQFAGDERIMLIGKDINEWMTKEPDLKPLYEEFSLYFEKSLKSIGDKNYPNPFLETTMLADRISKWREELKAEGKAMGEAMGEARGEAKILNRMKEAGMSLVEISRITGLSEDEIAHLV